MERVTAALLTSSWDVTAHPRQGHLRHSSSPGSARPGWSQHKGKALDQHTWWLQGPQRQLFCSLCSGSSSHQHRSLLPHTGACAITPARHRRAEGVRLRSASTSCSTPARASPGHPARGVGSGFTLNIHHALVPDLSCLGDFENVHPSALTPTARSWEHNSLLPTWLSKLQGH